MRIYPWSMRCLIAGSMLMLVSVAPALFADEEQSPPEVVVDDTPTGGDADVIGTVPEGDGIVEAEPMPVVDEPMPEDNGDVVVDEPMPEDSGDVVVDEPIPEDSGDVVLEEPVDDCGVACMSEPPPEMSDCGEACMHSLGGDADGVVLQFSNGGEPVLAPEINVDAIGAGIADYVDTANGGAVEVTDSAGGVLVNSPPIDIAEGRAAGRVNEIRSGHLH